MAMRFEQRFHFRAELIIVATEFRRGVILLIRRPIADREEDFFDALVLVGGHSFCGSYSKRRDGVVKNETSLDSAAAEAAPTGNDRVSPLPPPPVIRGRIEVGFWARTIVHKLSRSLREPSPDLPMEGKN